MNNKLTAIIKKAAVTTGKQMEIAIAKGDKSVSTHTDGKRVNMVLYTKSSNLKCRIKKLINKKKEKIQMNLEREDAIRKMKGLEHA